MFEIKEEHKIVREQARKFCQKEIEPHTKALDDGEILPYDLMREFMKNFVPTTNATTVEELEEFREMRSTDYLTSALVGIELCKVSPSLALAMGASLGLCGGTILNLGTREQKEKYALPVMRGEKIGCWGLTEPEAGSDVISIKSTAKKDGDHYILNGSKTFITNAPYADIIVVYAKTDTSAPGHKGMSAFILERGMEGLSTGEPLDKMGMRGSPTGEIFMNDLKIHKNRLLGTENRAFYEALMTLNDERIGAPTLCLAIIERCLEDSIKYAKQRVQFSQNIAFFEGIQFMLARMYTALQNCYGQLFLLAWMRDQGLDISSAASAAKLYASESATQCALDAIQIHGGYGYMKEYKMERFMRDAKLLEIGGGTSQIQMLVIARQILKDQVPELSPLFASPDPFAKMKEEHAKMKVSVVV